tara:strand:- start:674 stop:1093 length:420 start_codon:yes stop_codon:yes gene_type:complete
MREFFRPYTLIAQLTNTDVSSVTLTDSAGTALKSNFVSVETSSGSNDAWVSVTASSISVAQARNDTVPPASALLSTVSGLIGGVAPSNKGVVEFVLSDADRVDTLDLSLSEDETVNFFITYGQVQTGNPLRDGERPIGD